MNVILEVVANRLPKVFVRLIFIRNIGGLMKLWLRMLELTL